MIHLGLILTSQHPLDNRALQVRRKHGNELIHVRTQHRTASDADAGDAVIKQMTGIQSDQIRILFRIKRHAGYNTNAHPQSDIGLDDVRIGSRKYNPGVQPFRREGIIQS